MNKIYNEGCFDTMCREQLIDSVDLVITKPPSNKNIEWYMSLFSGFSAIVKKSGTVLLNLSYSIKEPHLMWSIVTELNNNTDFIIIDTIIVEKETIIKNSRSKSRLSNCVDFIIVFSKNNKPRLNRIEVVKNNQKTKTYNQLNNYLKIDDNSKYKEELSSILIDMYGGDYMVVYDPFIGDGTTAKIALDHNMIYYGSEISVKKYELSLTNTHQVRIVNESPNNIIICGEDDSYWDS